MDRRGFLAGLGFASALSGCRGGSRENLEQDGAPEGTNADAVWDWTRRQFELSPGTIHMSALLVATHPRPVRDAIRRYREELDRDPVERLTEQNAKRTRAVRTAAAGYLACEADEIALTDSTTMGISLVYHGLDLRPGDEVVTTEHDYYVTHEALRQVAARSGAVVRQVPLYDELRAVSADEIVGRLAAAVSPGTRAMALTWVHSGSGLKLPLRRIAEALEAVNRGRDERDRVLLCVDGVHGFGVEDAGMRDLGADLFMAGCHKWLFGPRGTGIVWGRPQAWARLRPLIPSFTDGSWSAWAQGIDPPGPTTAQRMSPGGFKPFEHRWAMAEAFDFHRRIGRGRVAERTHALARQLKEGLARTKRVRLHTPLADELSAGIVCFEVRGLKARAVVQKLAQRGVVATATPYRVSYPRLTPCIYNTPDEVDRVLREVRELSA
jgi:selenocysteine lyase/cysteine desulfurase